MSTEPSTGCAAHAARPYLRIPVDLIVAFNERPSVVGLYAAITRLNLITKHAVVLSRADLAHWCDAERDALAGQIKRGTDDLAAGGWLVVDRTGRKSCLLAGWGHGSGSAARPLRFDRADRGRPKGLRFVTLPLDMLDSGLGRLTPDPDDAASVERYVDRALLTFADIGTYALRQLAHGPLTPRLDQLGLCASDDAAAPPAFPALPDILARAAAGTLATCDDAGTAIPVALTSAGTAYLRRAQARATRDSDDQDGSVSDPAQMFAGSLAGSQDSISHYAAEGDEPTVLPRPTAAWDQHGNHESINMESPPNDSHGAHRAQATGVAMRSNDSDQASPNRTRDEQPIENLPTPLPPESTAACEENHIATLDPFLVAWHRALNPDRVVPDAELFALLDLQARHGAASLRRWMFGASSAGKNRVSPRYYDTCAAADACAAFSGSRRTAPPVGLDLPPAASPVTADESLPTTSPAPRPRPAVAPPRRLSAAHAALIAEIAARTGRAFRRPDKLADVPLDLLAHWRDIAAHPGLLARWDDPLGWLITEITQGHAPPPLDELTRWAEQSGVHWADPRLAPFRADMAESALDPCDDSETDCDDVDPTSRTTAPRTDAELWDVVCQLLGALDRATRRLLRDTRLLVLRDDVAVVSVPDVPTKALIEQRYTGPIRDLLRDHVGRPVQLRLVIAPAGTPCDPPPAWIDPATWPQLAPGLRTALAGSTLEPDGNLAVSAAAYDALCTHWPADLRALLAHAPHGQAVRDAS